MPTSFLLQSCAPDAATEFEQLLTAVARLPAARLEALRAAVEIERETRANAYAVQAVNQPPGSNMQRVRSRVPGQLSWTLYREIENPFCGIRGKKLSRLGYTEQSGTPIRSPLEGCIKNVAERDGVFMSPRFDWSHALRGKSDSHRLRPAPALQLESWMTPEENAERLPSTNRPAARHAMPPEAVAQLGLTARQDAVLTLIGEGLSNKLIARRLGLTENTVKEHVSAILQRLGVSTRMQAALRLSGSAARAADVWAHGAGGSAPGNPAGGGALGQGGLHAAMLPGLTPRQFTVWMLIGEGLPNKLIARRLGLTENTVKEHVSEILRRLNVRTRMQAMLHIERLREAPQAVAPALGYL